MFSLFCFKSPHRDRNRTLGHFHPMWPTWTAVALKGTCLQHHLPWTLQRVKAWHWLWPLLTWMPWLHIRFVDVSGSAFFRTIRAGWFTIPSHLPIVKSQMLEHPDLGWSDGHTFSLENLGGAIAVIVFEQDMAPALQKRTVVCSFCENQVVHHAIRTRLDGMIQHGKL